MFKHLIPLLTFYLKIKNWFYPWIKLVLNLKFIIFLWIVLVLIETWHTYPTWQKACLVNVTDGDTIKYQLMGSSQILIGRLWHIDAFEKAQKPWGELGYEKLKNLLAFNQYSEKSCHLFYLKSFERDKYGRNLILIKKNRAELQTINEKMVLVGWALIYPGTTWPERDQGKWKKMQLLAQSQGLGIWKYSHKIWKSPWGYRKSLLKYKL